MHSLIQTSDDFISICKQLLSNEIMSKLDRSVINPESIGIFVVWYAKEFQNHFGIFGTALPDGKYYTAKYDGIENQLYLDTYIKFDNKLYQIGVQQENTENKTESEPVIE